ncbi:hypothetical protein ABPG77_002291 [Micractinium sp. CCAP 211/92]
MALACRAALRLSPAAAAARRPAALLLCHSASGTAAGTTTQTAFAFERLPNEPASFPELFQPGRQAILLAVDPDLNGAVAALMRLELFDMPVELWRYGSGRDKKHMDAAGLIAILERYCPGSLGAAVGGAAANPVAPAPPKKARVKDGSKCGKRGRKKGPPSEAMGVVAGEAAPQAEADQQAGQDCAQPPHLQQHEQHQHEQHQHEQQQEPPVVRALIEYSTPQYISGKLSWYGLGFALGLLNGLLAVAGIPYERVPATTWKRGMGLQRAGKDGSIALACHLLPGAADLLKRKKDHGRAEALLLAAWGLGVRMRPIVGDGASASSEEDVAGVEPEEDGLDEAQEG